MSSNSLDAVRIQLEGSLEVVETLVAQWLAAASELEADPKLAGTGWYGLAEADAAGAHAVTELERRAVDHPLLTQLADARARVERALRQHTAAIGLELRGLDAAALLGDLRTKHPIDRVQVSRLAPKSSSFAEKTAGLAVWLTLLGVGLWNSPSDRARVVVVCFMVALLAWARWSSRQQSFPLEAQTQSATVAGRWLRLPGHDHFVQVKSATWSFASTLRLEFEQAHEITLDFTETPSQLVRVLHEHGVPIVDGSP